MVMTADKIAEAKAYAEAGLGIREVSRLMFTDHRTLRRHLPEIWPRRPPTKKRGAVPKEYLGKEPLLGCEIGGEFRQVAVLPGIPPGAEILDAWGELPL